MERTQEDNLRQKYTQELLQEFSKVQKEDSMRDIIEYVKFVQSQEERLPIIEEE